MTNETSGFRLYLQVRIGTVLATDDVCLTTCLAGREVTIRVRNRTPSISGAKWLVFEACGFPTEPEARAFGERLRANVQLAALCSALGADTGLDKLLSYINEDAARSEGWLKPHQRLVPDRHGLSVISEGGELLISHLGSATGSTTSKPEPFLGAMRELADHPPITESAMALSVRLLNLALINPQPLARIMLAVAAVEGVAEAEAGKWTGEQHALIKNLAVKIADPEVKKAVERMPKISTGQRIKRVLDNNDLCHLWGKWKDLYKRRSRLFHGGKEFTKEEIQKLDSDARKLCGKIILTIIKRTAVQLLNRSGSFG